MKKVTFLTCVLMIAACGLVRAQEIYVDVVGFESDNSSAVLAVRYRPEFNAFLTEYNRLIALWIEPLTLEEITNTFGAKLDADPADLALPVARPPGVGLPGIYSGNPADNKEHRDWYSIGTNGYLRVFFRNNDGRTVQAAVIYARVDSRFVPLKTEADYTNRLAWDRAKMGEISQWMEQHLPKAADLGAVEVPVNEQSFLGSVPATMEESFKKGYGEARYQSEVDAALKTKVALGDGRKCVVCAYKGTTDVAGNAVFYFIHVWLDLPPSATQAQRQGVLLETDYPDGKIRVPFDGKYYEMTLHLKTP
jgi:hypothetical protein